MYQSIIGQVRQMDNELLDYGSVKKAKIGKLGKSPSKGKGGAKMTSSCPRLNEKSAEKGSNQSYSPVHPIKMLKNLHKNQSI